MTACDEIARRVFVVSKLSRETSSLIIFQHGSTPVLSRGEIVTTILDINAIMDVVVAARLSMRGHGSTRSSIEVERRLRSHLFSTVPNTPARAGQHGASKARRNLLNYESALLS
jgi:hypothetical protein